MKSVTVFTAFIVFMLIQSCATSEQPVHEQSNSEQSTDDAVKKCANSFLNGELCYGGSQTGLCDAFSRYYIDICGRDSYDMKECHKNFDYMKDESCEHEFKILIDYYCNNTKNWCH